MLYKTPVLLMLTLLLTACGSGSDQQDEAFTEAIAIAYIQRSVPLDEDEQPIYPDARRPYTFMPGAALYLKAQADATTPARNITANVFAEGEAYDVRDLSASADGTKLLFALRAPAIEDADDDEQPTWNIWQYDLENEQLTRIIRSDLQAEAGQDYAPQYLADGRIVFVSTRQRDINAIRLDEGKPQFPALDEQRNVHAAVLHVMDADGSNIRQISFNMSHDYAPVLLANGRLVFSRWDNLGGRNQINLYTSKPDGTDLHLLYGSNSHDQGSGDASVQFLQAKPLDNGQLLVQMAPFNVESWGSNWQIIDTDNFTDHDVTTASGSGEQAQHDFFPFRIPTEAGLNNHGRYLDVSPLPGEANRFLVSWNPCRIRPFGKTPAIRETALICSEKNLNNPAAEEAYPNAGLWIYQRSDNTQKPLVLPPPGQLIVQAVALAVRSPADWLADTDESSSFGFLVIDSVYDIDGRDSTAQGIATLRNPLLSNYNEAPARFLRLIKGVGIPDRNTRQFNNSAFGNSGQGMRQILGYVPLEPDGSVHVRVPANVPFTLSVLNADGQRIGARHNIWLQLRPGETLHCTGCHDRNSEAPHGRPDAQPASINPGAPADGEAFPNTLDSRLAIFGETMADTYARTLAARELSPDLFYQDDWTDSAVTPLADSIRVQFRNEDDPEQGLATAIPTEANCLDNWDSFCRISIHYETHIQPIWDKPRPLYDNDGITVLDDYQCSACHDRTDAMGQLQLPPAQLELTSRQSDINNRYFMSYTDLLVRNLEQEIGEGILQNRTEEIPVLDDDGLPLLDENDQPVTQIITFPLTLTMSTAGAANSSRFFNTFTDNSDPIHFMLLSPIELKLIREWLDIGAQYYNNPFEAP